MCGRGSVGDGLGNMRASVKRRRIAERVERRADCANIHDDISEEAGGRARGKRDDYTESDGV